MVDPKLKRLISFGPVNLSDRAMLRRVERSHIIFCRNVMIYFDRATQERLLQKFCSQLRTDGYLFIGHSESLTGMDLPLSQHAPTVYRKV